MQVIKPVAFLLILVSTLLLQSARAADTGETLLARGRQAYTQQGPDAALPDFEKALDLFRSAGDHQNEAIALGFIASCHRKLGNLDKALQFAQNALEMKEALGDRGEVGKTHNQMGLIYWERADYPAAIEHLQNAIEIAASVGDKELEGSARNNLGLVFDEKGEYDRSLEQYQQALAIHRASHFQRGEGDTLGNIGGVYLLLGRFQEALPYYRQALEISDRLGLKPASSDDLGNIALCLAGMGDVDAALETFDRALRVAKETGLAKEEADWHKGKGTTLVSLGRYDAALLEYAAAEQVYEHSGLQRELVESLSDTAMVYELLGDIVNADARFQHSLQLAEKIGNPSGESSTLLASGDLERRRKRYDIADRQFAKALDRATLAKDNSLMLAVLVQRAKNDIDRQRYEDALAGATKAQQLASEAGNLPEIAQSEYVLGEALRQHGDLSQALDSYAGAAGSAKTLRDPELQWRVTYGQGQALQQLGRNDDAIRAYKDAIAVIENTRSGISEERYRAGYLEDRFQVYVALVDLLLKMQKTNDAFFYSEKLRTRSYIEQSSSAEVQPYPAPAQRRMHELEQQIRTLRHAIQQEYSISDKQRRSQALQVYSTELNRAEREYEDLLDNSRLMNAAGQVTPTSSEIQRVLKPDTALLEYVVGPRNLGIMVVTDKWIRGFQVPSRQEDLSSRTELLRDLIVERRPEWVRPAKALYDLVLGSVEAHGYLDGIRKLLIVPDGVLNYVPFAALLTRKDQFLCDKFTLGYTPAAAALVRETAEASTGTRLLAMAPGNTHLLNAAAEARGISVTFTHERRIVTGRAATETLFKQLSPSYDYIHLATHASLNRNAPMLSALELEPDSQNDGRLELHEISALRLHARLVTLSACETALGTGYFTETPPGDEFVGLTRAFLAAGTRNVLASLWEVNDAATRELMVRFYHYVLETSPTEALARAQRDFRRREPQYRNPFYWAAFETAGPLN